jgi:hypothetical protein
MLARAASGVPDGSRHGPRRASGRPIAELLSELQLERALELEIRALHSLRNDALVATRGVEAAREERRHLQLDAADIQHVCVGPFVERLHPFPSSTLHGPMYGCARSHRKPFAVHTARSAPLAGLDDWIFLSSHHRVRQLPAFVSRSVAIACFTCSLAVDARATQQIAPTERPVVAPAPWYCFRGRPLPDCRGFFLTEVYTGVAFAHWPASQHFDGLPYVGEGAVGYLWNLDARQAIGGLAFVEGGGSAQSQIEARAGLRFRYRLWLNDAFSLDASPGVALVGVGPIGFSGDLAFNVGDLIAPYLRLEVIRSPGPALIPGVAEGETPVYLDPHRTVLSAGIRFGSYSTPIIAAAVLVALPVVIIVAGTHRND